MSIGRPIPDPSYFRCQFCGDRVDVVRLPKHAWVRSASRFSQLGPEYVFACDGCRRRKTGARPDPTNYRCLDCDDLIALDEGAYDAMRLQHDAEAIIRERGDIWHYYGRCGKCQRRRGKKIRDRDEAERAFAANAERVELQMARIADMVRHHRAEGMKRKDAVAWAVEVEMTVADAARFPAFARWLRRQQRKAAPRRRRVQQPEGKAA